MLISDSITNDITSANVSKKTPLLISTETDRKVLLFIGMSMTVSLEEPRFQATKGSLDIYVSLFHLSASIPSSHLNVTTTHRSTLSPPTYSHDSLHPSSP